MNEGEVLNEHDRGSATWGKLQKHFNERLDTLRKQNDGNLSPEGTAKLRGRIAELKRVIDLGEAPKVPPEE